MEVGQCESHGHMACVVTKMVALPSSKIGTTKSRDALVSHIVTILRAAHCRSTHHYFALDALQRIETQPGKRLANILLKYHDEYLVGAKAPDTSFRDFQNHVLHVSDNGWGGAPGACSTWADHVREHLDHGRWKKAAYACGVLSHYFTDPLMPLHTGQTEKESVVHRPLEWSVCKSYDAIHALVSTHQMQPHFELSDRADWIRQAVMQGAMAAHVHYDQLIDSYNMKLGCKHPPAGLDDSARMILAELFALATFGWARILERLADETSSEIPNVSLKLATVLATLDMPLAWIVRKISDVHEQRAVKKIFAEFKSTGTVRRYLPRESKAVRAARANSSLSAPRVAPADSVSTTSASASVHPQPAGEPLTPPATDSAATSRPPSRGRKRKNALEMASDLVDAPSIGPKTARRFAKINIHTVGDFLKADLDDMVSQLKTRWIHRDLLNDWQDQARLVCQVPVLCGYKSQLLVAVDCRSREQLAQSNAFDLSQQIDALAQTSEGSRILRSSSVPTRDDIAEWITCAAGPTSSQAA